MGSQFLTKMAGHFAPGKLPSILIVDDDPDALYLAQHALERAGIKNPVVTMHGGAEAIDFLRSTCPAAGGTRKSKPGVVLLDIKMPMTGGFKVLRWLKNKKALQQTKVVMLTSSADPADQARATELGADAYVVKFPPPTALAALVRTVLVATPKK